MKKFLFLYPTRTYLDQEILNISKKLSAVKRLNEIIDARYRSSGYQIYWLLCCAKNTPMIPDVSLIDHRINIYGTDIIISSGIREKDIGYIYPSCEGILAQLNPVSELVLGGFHQIDCVDRVARAAHHNGLVVTVDEDTTDQLFTTINIKRKLPPIRRTWKEYGHDFLSLLEGMRNKFSHEEVNFGIQKHRAERKSKPWLVQI